MDFRSALRKGAELGVIFIAITTLILVGCGGGGSSGAGTTTVVSTSSTITPYKGPFAAGATVTITDANGNPVTLLTGGTVGANGVISVTYNQNVAYPLLVSVTGSYYNEVTKQMETTTVPLRGLITNAAAAANVPVTIVTETAVALLLNQTGNISPTNPMQAAFAVAALNTAGTMFGIPATTVPVFTASTNTTSNPNTILLSALAVVANSQTGSTLAAKVAALANSLASLNPASAPSSVISQSAFSTAITAMTSGASSVAATGVSPPAAPTISTASAALTNANAAIGASNSIVGGWTVGTGATASQTMFTFTADGHYMMSQAYVSGSWQGLQVWPGLEYGTYSYNPTTGTLVFNCPLVDTNGTAGTSNGYTGGFTDWGAPIGTCASASNSFQLTSNNSNSMSLTSAGSVIQFNRVIDSVNPVVGSWLMATGTATASQVIFTFTSDGHFMMDQAYVSGNAQALQVWPGLEYGTYTYDQNTGALAFSCPLVDTNGTAGTSNGYTGGFAVGSIASGVIPVGTQGGGQPMGACSATQTFTMTISGTNTLNVVSSSGNSTFYRVFSTTGGVGGTGVSGASSTAIDCNITLAISCFNTTATGNTWTWVGTDFWTPQLAPLWTPYSDTRTNVSNSNGAVTQSEIITSLNNPTQTTSATRYIDSVTGSLMNLASNNGQLNTVLPSSLTVGTTWTKSAATSSFSAIHGTISAINVTHTVPAGTFTNCVTVVLGPYTSLNSNSAYNILITNTQYWCPSVGYFVETSSSYTTTAAVSGGVQTYSATKQLQSGYIAN